MMEVLLLGLLISRPCHGYELKRSLERLVGYFGSASYGSLYPALEKLAKQGAVSRSVESQGERQRSVYRITTKGRQRFDALMNEDSTPFGLKMLYLGWLPAARQRQVLELQKATWERTLTERRSLRDEVADREVDRYRLALFERSIRQLEQDLVWIDQLLSRRGKVGTRAHHA